MFSQLVGIVGLVKSGIAGLLTLKSKRARTSALLGVLKFHFVLSDCVRDGEYLVEAAGPDPIAKLRSFPPDEIETHLSNWDAILRKQGSRLYTLQGYLFGEHHLAIVNPELQEQLSKAIGYKMQRVVTLHGIGSSLFFRLIFPLEETAEDKARLICTMAGEKSKETLNLKRIRKEIAQLRIALADYQAVVKELVPSEELLRLSKRARNETRFRGEA
jgi:hypothetical protein